MPHLTIKRKTPVVKMARALQTEMINDQKTLDDCSEWSFSGLPIMNKIQPYYNPEAQEIEPALIWIVLSGKRAFIYVPNDSDTETLDVLNEGNNRYKVGSDCLDVAKILAEVSMREVKRLRRNAGED